MTATSLSAGWKNEAGSWSFPAASTQGIPDLQTGIHTRSAILWRICSSSSKITAVLPPDMRRRPSIFMLLSALPVPLFGYSDSFKTDSRKSVDLWLECNYRTLKISYINGLQTVNKGFYLKFIILATLLCSSEQK